MPSSKTHRLLDLIALLSGRRMPVPVDEIMERIPGYAGKWRTERERDRTAILRTFERDKDALRDLGLPIDPVPIPGSAAGEAGTGYRLRKRDVYLPYVRLLERDARPRGVGGDRGPVGPKPGPAVKRRWATPRPQLGSGAVELDPAEAAAALGGLAHVAALPGFPLHREARSAFRKLAFDLDPSAFLDGEVLLLPAPGRPPGRRTMEALVDALLRGKRVGFAYRGIERDEESERSVEPYGLFLRRGRWYLVGRDLERLAIRVFRADRMDGVTANAREPASPDFEIPGHFQLATLAARTSWELRRDREGPSEVMVRFRSPPAHGGARPRPGSLVRRTGGSEVRSVTVGDARALLRWVLSLGGEAEITAPDALRGEFRASAARVAAIHASPAALAEERGGA